MRLGLIGLGRMGAIMAWRGRRELVATVFASTTNTMVSAMPFGFGGHFETGG